MSNATAATAVDNNKIIIIHTKNSCLWYITLNDVFKIYLTPAGVKHVELLISIGYGFLES